DVGRTFDGAFDDRSGEPQALNIRRDWLQLLENARTRRDQAPVTGACETRVIATSVAQANGREAPFLDVEHPNALGGCGIVVGLHKEPAIVRGQMNRGT